MEKPIKKDDLGVPLFQETHIWVHWVSPKMGWRKLISMIGRHAMGGHLCFRNASEVRRKEGGCWRWPLLGHERFVVQPRDETFVDVM